MKLWNSRTTDYYTINTPEAKRIAELEADNAKLREALDTELVCCHIGTLDSMKSPKHAVAAIARWHYDLGVEWRTGGR